MPVCLSLPSPFGSSSVILHLPSPAVKTKQRSGSRLKEVGVYAVNKNISSMIIIDLAILTTEYLVYTPYVYPGTIHYPLSANQPANSKHSRHSQPGRERLQKRLCYKKKGYSNGDALDGPIGRDMKMEDGYDETINEGAAGVGWWCCHGDVTGSNVDRKDMVGGKLNRGGIGTGTRLARVRYIPQYLATVATVARYGPFP